MISKGGNSELRKGVWIKIVLGAWVAQLEGCATLDLGVVSWNTTLGIEMT